MHVWSKDIDVGPAAAVDYPEQRFGFQWPSQAISGLELFVSGREQTNLRLLNLQIRS